MSLQEITIDLSNAAGVRLVLDRPAGNLAVTSNWHLKEIRRTAISAGAHDFFQKLRQCTTDQGITMGSYNGRFLSEDLNWVFVEMGTQAVTPELLKVMSETLAPLLDRVVVELHDGIDDVRGGTNVRMFLTDEKGQATGPWFWYDFVEKVVPA
jgi:hypothetical protein